MFFFGQRNVVARRLRLPLACPTNSIRVYSHSDLSDSKGALARTVAVGSKAAQTQVGAKGFIGNATNATAHYFGNAKGMGTMPHALIGYAGSTLKAAEMYVETFPEEPLTVLVDYYAREITDTLTVCRRFPSLASEGRLAVRLDTHGGRFVEGLDTAQSYAVLERHAPLAVRRYRNEHELRLLTGTGVSAAAIFHVRETLDKEGFDKVRIVASSGFDVVKCKVMADVNALMTSSCASEAVELRSASAATSSTQRRR